MRGKSCKRCKWWRELPVGFQVYVPGVATFDIDKAELLIAKRPRKPVVIPHCQIGRYIKPEQVDAMHVPHVDGSKPCIMAQVSHVVGVGRVLIEGRHRATQNLYAGRAMKVYLLTRAETKACIMHKHTAAGKARKEI